MEENEKIDDRMSRFRFKPLQYDTTANYERLQERIKISDMPVIRSISPAWRWFSIVASVALLLVSTLHFIDLKPTEHAWYEVTAVPDAKTKVVLPDSSTVWLNANACLHYPRSFDDENRVVGILGEAFFEVRKDPEKPFIVEMGRLHIKVLGTSFNVITDEEDDKITVTLIEGKIALYDSSRPGKSEKFLVPSEEAVFSKTDGEIAITTIRPESVMSWVSGQFYFDGNTLDEITRELERAFHVKIHIENETMRNKTFNAVFDSKETLDEILSILQIPARYTVEKRRGEIYIN
ncbi:MAG: FecR domain-containing protein [Tannerella sp.]|jgi:ferric-dicitrate binding protein FerR (iron transport regulator)|nr:FecR domain-containing protein [Tannerella sp.]